MTKQEMIALRKSLGTIRTTDKDTIQMANCLQFIDQKIVEAVNQERVEKVSADKPVDKKVGPEDATTEDIKK